jgi:glycosyltransferase involved in cell wall biosynthesis
VISVVIPTHGRRDLLALALESLAAQEDPGAFEVIVVDDGADPGLTEWAAREHGALGVQVVHHEVNRGRSATRNTGIAHAAGDVILFLDGDMRVVPAFLAAHARAHAGSDDTVVLGNIVTAPEVGRSAFVDYIDSRGVKKVRAGAEIPSRYFMTGNSSVAVPLLHRVGVFDEEFGEYGGEDTEMGYRLAAGGARFLYAPGALSYHMDLNSVPRMAQRLRRYGERMLPILVRKAPQAREDLGLYLAEPHAPGDPPGLALRRLAVRVLCRRAFWAPLAWVAQWWPRALRVDLVFDFVRAASYLDGYGRAARGRARG